MHDEHFEEVDVRASDWEWYRSEIANDCAGLAFEIDEDDYLDPDHDWNWYQSEIAYDCACLPI